MVAKSGLRAEVNLGARSSFREPGAGPKEPGVVVPGILAGFFLFLMASLGLESSSSLFRTAEPCWGFF